MLQYTKLIASYAFRDFAIKTDVWYAAVSVIVSGLTGTADKPVGSLTPFEIARYVLVAVIVYALLRLLIVGPYRLWKEQTETISGLRAELTKPQRLGSEELHRIAASKKLEMAAELQRFLWRCVNRHPEAFGDHEGAHQDTMLRLAAEVNPAPAFRTGVAILYDECQRLRDREGAECDFEKAKVLLHDLISYLHGNLTAEALKRRLPQDTELETPQ